MDLVVVLRLFVLMLVPLCFCVATVFRWIKIYIQTMSWWSSWPVFVPNLKWLASSFPKYTGSRNEQMRPCNSKHAIFSYLALLCIVTEICDDVPTKCTQHVLTKLRVSWTAKKTNEWVLNKAGVKRELLDTAKATKLGYCGHTMRKQSWRKR